jgi:hypothetical protein
MAFDFYSGIKIFLRNDLLFYGIARFSFLENKIDNNRCYQTINAIIGKRYSSKINIERSTYSY